MYFFQSMREIMAHLGKVTGRCSFPATDEDVVETVLPGIGERKPRDLAQPALGAVAGYGITDLLRAGEANAYAIGFTGVPLAELQGECRRGPPSSLSRAQEVGALGQDG